MTALTTVRAAGNGQIIRSKAKAIRSTGFDKRKSLKRLYGRPRIDLFGNISERKHQRSPRVYYGDGAAVAAFNGSTSQQLNQDWISHEDRRLQI
jgi:hypothetical protein